MRLNLSKSKCNVFIKTKLLPLSKLLCEINSFGGVCYLVGGSVRDLFLSKRVSDLDIEVHNLSKERLQEILSNFTPILEVGSFFGIIKAPRLNADFSIPRIDSIGRKPQIVLDPNLTIEKALNRRDVTVNAMAINLSGWLKSRLDCRALQAWLVDPFFGMSDLKEKMIHPVDDKKFQEDPLRLFRVMQFISRFTLKPSSKMDLVAQGMNLELNNRNAESYIAKERISDEFKKMFLLSRDPFLGLLWLDKINVWQKVFPSIRLLSKDFLAKSKAAYFLISLLKKVKVKDDQARIVCLLAVLLNGQNLLDINHFFGALSFGSNIQVLTKKILLFLNPKTKISAISLKIVAKEIAPMPLKVLLIVKKALDQITWREWNSLSKVAFKYKVLDKPELSVVSGKDLINMSLLPDKNFTAFLKMAYFQQLILGPKKALILKTFKT